jgi:hypothetical protein
MPWKEPTDKTRRFWTLLKEQALSYFEHNLMRRLEAEESELPNHDIKELVIRRLYLGFEYISKGTNFSQENNVRQSRGSIQINLCLMIAFK